VTDFEAGHAELSFGIMEVIGGELADPLQSCVGGQGLAVLTEDLHDLFRQPDPDLLADIDKGDGVEVFFHLDMTIGMDFGLPSLAELEGRRRQGF
jgi:hypothetical protein